MFVPRHQSVVEALDRLADWIWWPITRWLGIKPYPIDAPSRRHRTFRVVPIVLMAIAATGLGMMTQGHTMAGYSLVMCGWFFSIGVRQRSTMTEGHPFPDERQREISRAGHFWGLLVMAVLTLAGCCYAALAQPLAKFNFTSPAQELTGHALWFPSQPLEWMCVVFLLLTIEISVAVLVSGWAAPRGLDEID